MTQVVKVIVKSLLAVIGLSGLFYGTLALAATGGTNDLGGIATNITQSFQSIGELMLAVSYVAGIGFSIAAIFKFKQHKDNPTQIPIGTPIALLAIGVVLVFLPALFKPIGKTLLGSDATDQQAGGFTGQGVSQLPGGNSGGSQ